MELTFTETSPDDDNNNHQFPTYFASNSERQLPRPPLKKKGLVYSDILQNMNLVVVNGKLEFAKKQDSAIDNETHGNHYPSFSSQQPQQLQQLPSPFANAIHEYEYLKQQYPNLTKKEYLKQKVIDHLIYRREMARIASIKSPKLMFTGGNSPVRAQHLPSIRNLNSLFSLKK
jgi:hypothetical protein